MRKQFVSDFLVKSLDVLAILANTTEPPMKSAELIAIRRELLSERLEVKDAQKRLAPMVSCYKQRGDISTWDESVLAEIDNVFCKHFMIGGRPAKHFLFPGNDDNDNNFTDYCDQVDQILIKNNSKVPPYARQYFAYFSMWRLHKHAFPIPLGTSTVVFAVNELLNKYTRGVTEVIIYLHILLVHIHARV